MENLLSLAIGNSDADLALTLFEVGVSLDLTLSFVRLIPRFCLTVPETPGLSHHQAKPIREEQRFCHRISFQIPEIHYMEPTWVTSTFLDESL